MSDQLNVLPIGRVVQWLQAGLAIDILNDPFELILELILEVADILKFWVKQAPEVLDHLGRLNELFKDKVSALKKDFVFILYSEQVNPHLGLVDYHLLINLRQKCQEFLICLGIDLMDLPQVAKLLESPN